MQYVNNGSKTFLCDEAIPQYSRVKLDPDGRVTIAGLADVDVGVAMNPTFAAGEAVEVRLRNAGGTVPMIAIEAIEVGDIVYSEAAGKVQDTAASTGYAVGQAMTAAGADGDYLEVCRFVPGEANA
jgi:hypothetical protein